MIEFQNMFPILLILVLGFTSVNSKRIKNPSDFLNFNHRPDDFHSIKTVNYAFKNGNKVELSQIGVKNLKIEAFDDWLAKGLWTGDNYNQTG